MWINLWIKPHFKNQVENISDNFKKSVIKWVKVVEIVPLINIFVQVE
jgi:hypothetical protein